MHEDPEKEEFEVLQFKDNIIPRGLVPLEELFDFNYVARKLKMEPTKANIEECNIGSEHDPKIIKLSNTLPSSTKKKCIYILWMLAVYLITLLSWDPAHCLYCTPQYFLLKVPS